MAKKEVNQEQNLENVKNSQKRTKKEKTVKKLTFNEMIQLDKALDEQIEKKIKIKGQEYTFKIDKKFRKTKRFDVLNDLIKFMDECNRRIELYDMISPYTSLLIIKHFTDIDVPDGIDDALLMLKTMIDYEIFDKILNMMPEDEVIKMYEELSAVISRAKENIELAEELDEELQEQVENPELKEWLVNDKKEN